MDARSPLQRVVVAYDGSAPSRVALAQAVDLAHDHHLPVRLACAVDSTDVAATRAMLASAHELLAAGADLARDRVPDVTTGVLIGAPALVLLHEVRVGDLLVVGTHGRGPVARLLLGSVGTHLLANAGVPVLLARPASHPDGAVVVGVDGSGTSEDAAALAGVLASAGGVPLHLITALPPQVDGLGAPQEDSPADLAQAGRLVAEAAAAASREHPDLVVTTSVEQAPPVAALLSASRTARLVVVGSHGRGPVGRAVLGSVSRTVCRQASCPVLVVRAAPRHREGPRSLVGATRGTHRESTHLVRRPRRTP